MALSRREVENTLRTIFRRCVQCPDTAPACPVCKSDEICSQSVATCDSCASTSCVQIADSGATNNSSGSGGSGGPNIGAIVGGVVGGVVLISVIVFGIWWFSIRARRQQQDEEWEEEELASEKVRNSQFTMQREARNSTHTVASMASSVLTRASNIIQIAYIPGVTNRSGPNTSPSLLVPPVPPIPAALTSGQTSPYSTDDQHFFVPGDLRDSTYSASTTDGHSIRSSLARSSVATTIYRDDAVVNPMPAQTIVRGKAAVVSVSTKSTGSQGSSETTTPADTPPVPQVDFQKHSGRPTMVRIPSSSDNTIRSPSGSVRSAATVGRPTALNITKGKATQVNSPPLSSAIDSASSPRPSIGLGLRPLTEVSVVDSVDSGRTHERANQSTAPSRSEHSESDDDEDPHSRSRRSLLDNHDNSKRKSPFSDPDNSTSSESLRSPPNNSVAALSTVIEEATKRASRDVHQGLGLEKGPSRGRSPFGDEGAI